MAQFYPKISDIQKSRHQPEPGEMHLLNFLASNLPDEYEVYFQPFLNGDRPDIIIMRPRGGVLIIEVKDWILDNYLAIDKSYWQLKTNNARIKSPIEQVEEYKKNLYNLHIEHLIVRNLFNNSYYAVVSCAVYFHLASETQLAALRIDSGYTELLGNDSLTASRLNDILISNRLNERSRYFDDTLYKSFRRYLQPPSHTLEDGIDIKYREEQKRLIESRPIQQKIRGVAGSGKTKVMAKRAVNAYLRTNSQVLILTFNITLRNYIHDRISEVRAEYPWNSFYIIHYHQFFSIEANNHGLVTSDLTDYDNEHFFESVKGKINKYSAIFVDEVQDFESSWIRIVKKYFLDEGGEFVVFGDEKQNIYKRAVAEDKKPNTTIVGRWNELSDSYRSSSKIIHLAFEFQDFFFENKYELDDINIIEQEVFQFGQDQVISYISFPLSTNEAEVYRQFKSVVEEHNIHPNDVCVVSSRVSFLREWDYMIRTIGHEDTAKTFEAKEEYDALRKVHHDKDLERQVDQLRKCRKFHFWANSGTIKLSTIHSFKGWEAHTLVLVIHNDEVGSHLEEALSDELVYTAITRCRQNLIVLSVGDTRYKDFLNKYIGETKYTDLLVQDDSTDNNYELESTADRWDDGDSWLGNMSPEERWATLNNLDMLD